MNGASHLNFEAIKGHLLCPKMLADVIDEETLDQLNVPVEVENKQFPPSFVDVAYAKRIDAAKKDLDAHIEEIEINLKEDTLQNKMVLAHWHDFRNYWFGKNDEDSS